MSLQAKRMLIGILGFGFLVSLLIVQWAEVNRRAEEAGLSSHAVNVPDSSRRCVECHEQQTPGIVEHWKGSTHARKQVGCLECHQADRRDADAYEHEGQVIATIVTPRDCSRCHVQEAQEFWASHHSKAGQILHSLDNYLAETVEGNREPFNPHGPTAGRDDFGQVNGMAAAFTGCHQCHGSKVAIEGTDGSLITSKELEPDADGRPTALDVVARIKKDQNGKPVLFAGSWPNTGIGRFNLDGSEGSCSACHSRHDFSPRRARQPENCGKCHLGPDHPQKEIYEESKHGVAFRDLKDSMNLDSPTWVLGKDYSAAPTCATCHMSGNTRNGGKVTHDPGERLSWTNRPPVSLPLDTDINGKIVTEADPAKRAKLVHKTWQEKRDTMKQVCSHCHASPFINSFYKQYDDFIQLYNEKYGKPGMALMKALTDRGLLTKKQFDERLEWTWFYLWHHEGRRARHGASMMAPDYAHWHGTYEVAERWYTEMIPEIREILAAAKANGKAAEAAEVEQLLDEILSRPEHAGRIKDEEVR
ncbi:MAG: multiheme c-type cytochrome [Planctomycetota bacterium]